MKIQATLFAGVVLISTQAFASSSDTFAIQCNTSEVSCDDLFSDLITTKFTKTFSHNKWAIFVHSANFAYSDGSGVASVIAGIVEQNKTRYSYFPLKRWSRAMFRPAMGNAYERKEALRQAIRKTIESMMAECEDSPTCNLAPQR